MLKRCYFALVILFWVTMNVLLWRSEMSGRQNQGARLPVAAVWERVLTAPDDSSLQILHRGQKLGYCRWVANVIESAPAASAAPDTRTEIEGRVGGVAGYTVDLDGNVLVEGAGRRVRFTAHLEFGTNQTWRKLQFRILHKPMTWEVQADAAAETVRLLADEGGAPWERTFTFAELQRPETLLASLGAPAAYVGLAGLMQGMPLPSPARVSLGLNWEARNDWLTLGHSKLRVYRVEARLLEKYRAVLDISRVGELLRAEFPDELVLVNEALLNLAPAP